MLDKGSDMEEIDQDSRGSDEDVWEEGGVDFAEIARQETVLLAVSTFHRSTGIGYNAHPCNQFALLELSADHCDVALLVQLCAAHL